MAANQINTLNIFLGTREQNVTFCIDISGSMYSTIKTVKEQLIQYLLEQSVLAKLNLNRLFNLVAFSTEVYPWANNMVLWNTATVNSCINWINDLETKTGTNTLDALITSFTDNNTNAVVLVTDDLPDQDAYTVLDQVSQYAKGRPVHCIYISSSREDDQAAIEFLQNLATITRGSFKIVTIGRFGVEKITPICSFDAVTTFQLANLTLNANTSGYPYMSNTQIPNSSASVLSTPNTNNVLLTSNTTFSTPHTSISTLPTMSVLPTTYQPVCFGTNIHPARLVEPTKYAFPNLVTFPRVLLTNEGKIPSTSVAWSRFRPVRVLYDGTVVGLTNQNSNIPIQKDIAYTPDIGNLLVNRTVVARSIKDGHYYKGKVITQILAHRFNIKFGPSTHGKYTDCFYQDTPIYDIIAYDDAISHPVKTNDKVLALIDGVEKYAPAEVLEGFEKRSSSNINYLEKLDSSITVRFSNGSTRTLPPNEAIWIPDAVFERIQFEMNLPSTARKYLEEYNDEYPNKSLPGCPHTSSISKSAKTVESVVMPRMVYDIWPYYVPFYPLYSNVLYPTCKEGTAPTNISIGNTSIMSQLPLMSYTQPYGRQIKTKPAAVNAECINRSIIGSVLTPEQLDEKIRQQIYSNRHLFENRSRSRSKSRNSEHLSNDSCDSCNCNKTSNHRHQLPHRHSHELRVEHFHNSHDDSYNFHNHTDHASSHNESWCRGNGNNKQSLSNYEDTYKSLIQNLYNEFRVNEHNCYCKSDHDNLYNKLRRSKSVTFSENNYDDLENHDHHHYHHHHHHHGDDESDDGQNPIRTVSTNTDVTFSKKVKSKKPQDLTSNVPDRFGNPKVSFGLPDRPLKQRPRSASGNLDHSLIDKSIQSLILEEHAKLKREHVARKEKAIQEKINENTKIQDLRDQYHKMYSAQIREFEKRRTDDSFNKNVNKNTAKREINTTTAKRFENNKTDIEVKEQQKYNYLRNQTNKRNVDHYNKQIENDLREANKIAYKKVEQQKRNQFYHDRLLVEEAVRKAQQKQVQAFHNQTKNSEIKRENKEQKLQIMNKSVKENDLAKAQNNFLKTK